MYYLLNTTNSQLTNKGTISSEQLLSMNWVVKMILTMQNPLKTLKNCLITAWQVLNLKYAQEIEQFLERLKITLTSWLVNWILSFAKYAVCSKVLKISAAQGIICCFNCSNCQRKVFNRSAQRLSRFSFLGLGKWFGSKVRYGHQPCRTSL